ncbi:YodC family protein [Burkholderia guangdongensis]|uniref:YodC family protein n=1 Tax=Burkholderia guangdongensis TaxID=1792500 RepID=UPI0015CB2430|nr:YodC family protein [Burkholderia guangdongensis]
MTIHRDNHRTRFRIGDVVTLKSGGPRMTVIFAGVFDDADELVCQWFDERGHFRQETFHRDVLAPQPRAIPAGLARLRMQARRYSPAA